MRYLILALSLLLLTIGCASRQVQDAETWQLRYNYLENEWTYAPGHAELNYNYMEQRWEFTN